MNQKCSLFRDAFIESAAEKLGKLPIDYSETMNLIRASKNSKDSLSAAGVLLLIDFNEKQPIKMNQTNDFKFILIKRSSTVSQPSDLSCPGGMLNNFIDPLLRLFIISILSSTFSCLPRKYALNRDARTFRLITLFLANAVRETWEEINISPDKIEFLGPLPTYSLHIFRRIIFPLVGFIKKDWSFKPNAEVEKIVEIPLKVFCCEKNYAIHQLDIPVTLTMNNLYPRESPCIIFKDNQGNEEILWGATFNIIMNFLKIIFDFELPALKSNRIIKKDLYSNYIIG